MTEEEFYKIIDPEILRTVSKFENRDPASLALQLSKHNDWPTRAIVEQVSCREKAKSKIPEWISHGVLLDETALQQSSSEATARYKRNLPECRGTTAMDLTGGLGVDSAALSKHFNEFCYVDSNPVMCLLARYNFERLGLNNILVKNGDGLHILTGFPDNHFDLIYVDPSRRINGRRVISLQNSVPDVVANLDLLKRKAKRILLKLSPMMDITDTVRLLPEISYIDVVSYDGECREILVMLQSTNNAYPFIRATQLDKKGEINYQLQRPINQSSQRRASRIGQYLYYPDPAFIKADMIDHLGQTMNLSRIHPSVIFLTSNALMSQFPGKIYQTIQVISAHAKDIRNYMKTKHITKANIITRGFPETPDLMYKRLKLAPGGNDYLFFTSSHNDQYIVIHSILGETSVGGTN